MKFICHLADCGDAVQVPCSSSQSEIIPLLCNNHFTVVFGLELCPVNIPETVTKCLGPTRAFDTIGKKLFARSPLRWNTKENRRNNHCSSCYDDVVFETGDTVLVFAEYAEAAFAEEEKCKGNNVWKKRNGNENDMDDCDENSTAALRNNESLMPQRCFSRCLSSLRLVERAMEDSENGSIAFLYYRDARNSIYMNMKEAISRVKLLSNDGDENNSNRIIIDALFDNEKIVFGNDPLYLCRPFHLSKPLIRFYDALKSDGVSIHTNMPWQTADDDASVPHFVDIPNDVATTATLRSSSLKLYDDFVAKEIQIFRFRTLLRTSIPSLSNSSSSKQLPMTNISCVMTKKDLYVATVNTQVRLDVAFAESNEAELRRLTFRPLLNQYDDSVSGRCHRHYLPLHSRLLSAKALSVIAFTVIPLSTGKYESNVDYLLTTDNVTAPSLQNKFIFKIFEGDVDRLQSATNGSTASASDNYSQQLHTRQGTKRKKLTLVSVLNDDENERSANENNRDTQSLPDLEEI